MAKKPPHYGIPRIINDKLQNIDAKAIALYELNKMTNEKELREPWNKIHQECVNDNYQMTGDGIADWWLSKLHSHTQEVVAKIEGMKEHSNKFVRKPPSNETTFSKKMRRANNNYIKGQQQALDDVLALLKEDNNK